MKSDIFTNFKGINIGITIALIAIAGVLVGAILNGMLGMESLANSLFASSTPTASFKHTPIPLFAPPTAAPAAALTPLSVVAEELTPSTTVQAPAFAPSVESTLPADQPAVVTATVTAALPTVPAVADLLTQLSTIPAQFSDSFDDDSKGWTPYSDYGYDVVIQNGAMQIFFSEPSFTPFLWTCDACGPFERASYQLDVKVPVNGQVVIAGLVFGSPTPIDEYPFKEAYALSLYNNGSVILQRISATGMETVQLWDKNATLLKPDGQAHNLQVIADGQSAWVVIDGKPLGDKIDLAYATAGYAGLVVYSPNATVYFDNLKVIPLP